MSGRDGRLGVARSSSPSPRPARTPSCAAPAATRPTSRRSPRPRRPRGPIDGPARRPGAPHAEHADHRDAGRLPQRRGPRPHLHRRRHPQERAGQDPAARRAPSGRCSGVGVPGDREVDMKRLEAALDPAEVALLDEADFAAHPFLVKGYIGPVALAANGVRYLVDPRIVTGTAWVTGADKPDHHVVDLVAGRDFTPDGTIEAAEVRARRPRARRLRPAGGGARHRDRAHLPARPQVHRRASGSTRSAPNGKPIRITMGSYGVGVSRLVAAIAEQSADEHGLVWPRCGRAVRRAPGDRGQERGDRRRRASDLAAALDAVGLRVLLDDRKASPGVKFADAELIGVPTIVVVGRGLRRRQDRGQGPPQRRARGDPARRGRRAPRRARARVGSPDRAVLRSGERRRGARRRSRRTGGRVTGGDRASPSASATAHCPPCV